MSLLRYHNGQYSSGIPTSIGDKYYAQDLFRDFWSTRENINLHTQALLRNIGNCIIAGCEVTQGAGNTVNITAGQMQIKFPVTTPTNWSALPPATSNNDIYILCEVPALTNQAIVGVDTGGSNINYLKIAYAESSTSSRSRQKKTGSYNSEISPSYTLTCNTTPPTAYELAIATFTNNGSVSTFTQAEIRINKWISVTSTYTAQLYDRLIEGNGTFTINLPPVATAKYQELIIANVGIGVLTIDANSSETIEGILTWTVNSNNKKLYLYCNGIEWKVINKNKPKNYINGLNITNTTTTITVKSGFEIVANDILYTFDTDQIPSLSTIIGYLSGGGCCWVAVCIDETTGVISCQVLGVGTSGISAANTLGVAIGDVKYYTSGHTEENQLNMGSIYNTALGYCRAQKNGTGDWYRIFGVFKLTVGFTDSSASCSATTYPDGYKITVASTANYSVNQVISESGATHVPANSEIVEITSATDLRMNNLAASSSGTFSLIVADSITDINEILKRPKTKVILTDQVARLAYLNGALAGVYFHQIEFDLLSEISGVENARLLTKLYQSNVDMMFDISYFQGSSGSIDSFYCYRGGRNFRRKTVSPAGSGSSIGITMPMPIVSLKASETILLQQSTSTYQTLNGISDPRGTIFSIMEN